MRTVSTTSGAVNYTTISNSKEHSYLDLAKTRLKTGLVGLAKIALIGALTTAVVAGTVAASAGGLLATFAACAGLNFAAGLITHKVIKYTQDLNNEPCPILGAALKAFTCFTAISLGGVFGTGCTGGALAGGIVGASVFALGVLCASGYDQHGGS